MCYIADQLSGPDFRWQPIVNSTTQPAKIMQQLTEIRTIVNAMHLLLESGSPGQLQEGRPTWPEPSQQAWRNIRATIKRVVALMRYLHTAAIEALCESSAELDGCTFKFADMRITLLQLLLKVTDHLVKGLVLYSHVRVCWGHVCNAACIECCCTIQHNASIEHASGEEKV